MTKHKNDALIENVPQGKLVRFRRALLGWYAKNGRNFPWRRKSASKYEIIVAEVLLQRTRAETVAGFYRDFIKEFPSWKKLAGANEKDLAIFLRPIGLWRRRSASLSALAQVISRRNGRFPRNREEVEALPGVGQYIANAVLLFCHDEPQPLLDVNMARVLERVFGPRQLADIRYDPYLQSLSSTVVNCRNPREINWAILDLAATTCRDSAPRCHECPLRPICLYQGGP
jgi:A/G-specific adenine glycosylase